jgi:hypothetical protein
MWKIEKRSGSVANSTHFAFIASLRELIKGDGLLDGPHEAVQVERVLNGHFVDVAAQIILTLQFLGEKAHLFEVFFDPALAQTQEGTVEQFEGCL